MNALVEQPTNLNYLSPLGFKFTLRRLPMVNYFCQSVDIPAISMTPINTPTPVGTLVRLETYQDHHLFLHQIILVLH
jgi:hypothetical protein